MSDLTIYNVIMHNPYKYYAASILSIVDEVIIIIVQREEIDRWLLITAGNCSGNDGVVVHDDSSQVQVLQVLQTDL